MIAEVSLCYGLAVNNKGLLQQSWVLYELSKSSQLVEISCKNAILFMETPVVFTKKLLGADFNQGSIDDNPAVSFDGNTLVYTEHRGNINAIFFSKRKRGICYCFRGNMYH